MCVCARQYERCALIPIPPINPQQHLLKTVTYSLSIQAVQASKVLSLTHTHTPQQRLADGAQHQATKAKSKIQTQTHSPNKSNKQQWQQQQQQLVLLWSMLFHSLKQPITSSHAQLHTQIHTHTLIHTHRQPSNKSQQATLFAFVYVVGETTKKGR